MVYNNKRGVLYAASRDRTVYAWNWPRETRDENSEEPTTVVTEVENVLIPEPAATLQGHSLGVSALAHSEGMGGRVCGHCTNQRHVASCPCYRS